MKITEQNYEEYFLLYTDNELGANERKAVEDFVAQNPQYNAFFTALGETKLPADDSLSFFNKEGLYKDETTEIGITNYEEYFLLYTDNELSEEQKKTTERFVLQHPQLQEEFVLLQQTKLTPDIIEYKNKEELYKKERRLLPMYVASLSVAAALFAVLFFTGVMLPQHQQGITLAATSVKQTNKTIQQTEHKSVLPPNVTTHQKEQIQNDLLVDKAIKNALGKKSAITVTNQNSEERKEPVTTVHQSQEADVTASVLPEEKQPVKVSMPDNNLTAKQVAVLKPLEEFDADQTNTTTALSLSDNSTAQPAVYKELNTEDDDHTLYVSGLPINKNKVTGFLKSASRLLGGHAKQNEE